MARVACGSASPRTPQSDPGPGRWRSRAFASMCGSSGRDGARGQPGPVPSCAYSLAPASADAGPGQTDGSVSVQTDAGCPWTAVSDVAVADPRQREAPVAARAACTTRPRPTPAARVERATSRELESHRPHHREWGRVHAPAGCLQLRDRSGVSLVRGTRRDAAGSRCRRRRRVRGPPTRTTPGSSSPPAAAALAADASDTR